MPNGRQWIYLVGIALVASLGQFLLTLAYQKDRAPVVASASYSSIILSVIYGYFFWGEVPHALVWVGGGFIVLGGIILLGARFRVSEPLSPSGL